MTIGEQVAALGLDPRGYRVVPDAQDYADAGEDEFALDDRWVPWDADAEVLTGDPEDAGRTVLDHLSDLAGAHGMDLTEYLAEQGGDDEDDAVDY